ncbi:hypothetical protein SGP3_0004 (plasmid) [Sodalis glossinidius str. 'morsitans']|uniref:Uncharacterized protein n=1 Tax=Sodalis glossinidius (strain morsitans) TaxID=343509 RepID=Q2NPY7_SODGM|nr:hypothetical protein SGP3_0004 [Sodalis glossinidius str. 'morsitans']
MRASLIENHLPPFFDRAVRYIHTPTNIFGGQALQGEEDDFPLFLCKPRISLKRRRTRRFPVNAFQRRANLNGRAWQMVPMHSNSTSSDGSSTQSNCGQKSNW